MIEWFSATITSSAVARRFFEDHLLVERLDRRRMQDCDIDADRFQRIRRFQRAHRHEPGRNDECVLAVAQKFGFAELETIVVLVENQRNITAQQAHVDRAFVRGDGWHGLLDIECIAGIDDRQVGHGAEDRQVIGSLVARP